MSDQLSRAILPDKRTVKVTHVGTDASPVQHEYKMRPLRDDELQNAKATIGFVLKRIERNGGDCSPSAIDSHGAGDRDEWAKRLLKYLTGAKGSTPWSYNDALQLNDALHGCEIKRATEALREAKGGVSEDELRRRYNDWRNGIIAETKKPTGEIVNGVRVVQGGAIPDEFEDWIISQADHATLSSLQGMRNLLLFGQVISDTKLLEVPTLPMLYEPEVAPTIAAQLARYLVRESAIPKTRYKPTFDALLTLFAGTDSGEMSFSDRCRHAYWSFTGTPHRK